MKKILALALAVAALSMAAQETESNTSTAPAAPAATTTTVASPQQPAQPAQAAPAEVVPPPAGSRVIAVDSDPQRKGRVIRLRDEIRVSVRGYDALAKDAAARQKPITLWINGIDSQLAPVGIEPYTATTPPMTTAEREDARVLTFFLTRTTDNAEMWRDILRDPFGEPETDLAFSVGVSGASPLLLASDIPVNGMLRLEKTYFSWGGVLWGLLVIAVIVALFWFKSDMLRNGPDIDDRKQAYSLGRSQMAWWFILILASYITIWLITGDRDTITSELLVLMGISAATAMGSIAIDSAAPGRANDARQDLEAEKQSLLNSPTASAGKTEAATPEQKAASDAVDLRVKEIDATIASVTTPPITTGSWLRDVLTGNDGNIAFHRFQVLVWTFVLGLIFLASVARDLSMPEFSTTLLALMGISAGTYLGFKLPTNGG